MAKNTTTTVHTTVNKADAKEVKFYLIDGIRYATAANWRHMGLQPAENAKATLMTTKNGYEFSIYAETVTEKYDAKAAAEKAEKNKELKKQQTELFRLYMKHEIGLVDYTTAMADIAKQLA